MQRRTCKSGDAPAGTEAQRGGAGAFRASNVARATETQRQEFLEGIRTAVEGTPYVIAETDDGFDVTLDIVDAKWFGLYHKEGLKRVYTHHVQVPGDRTYAVTDDSRTVEWQAGLPTVSASVERTRGRVYERSTEKVWALGEDLKFGAVVD